ncbi:MAG: hypothetical protein IJ282_10240 [Lachnospiraceae bacterium]|nr:hypothetical protein [Lachnospiraceae bacterium]
MKKRISVLLLAMTMVLATLVGCGSTEETGNQNDNTSASANVETNVSDEKETKSNNTSANTEVESNVSDATDEKETETDEKDSSVITFDEMLDSMVTEYGEVEIIPVFAERNFEDTIANLETQLRPTEHKITSVMVYHSEWRERTFSDGYVDTLVTADMKKKYNYVPVTYDGENYYVTYPEILFDEKYTNFYHLEIPELPYTPGIPSAVDTKCESDGNYSYNNADGANCWVLDFGRGSYAYGDEYNYRFGEKVHHFTYEGESYIFLYRICEFIASENPMTFETRCEGIVLKDTDFTKDKTTVTITGFYPDSY